MEDVQRRFARELGFDLIQLVIPRRKDKHYGLLQDTLAQLPKQGRTLSRLLVCRGFGLSVHLFQKISDQTGGKVSSMSYASIPEFLTRQFPPNPGTPVNSERLLKTAGPKLLVVHEPLELKSPTNVVSQFGLVPGSELSIDYIEISENLSKNDLLAAVHRSGPTSVVVSYHAARNWVPFELLRSVAAPEQSNFKIWHGKTLFHALNSLMVACQPV
jgi:hypothetical protein